MAVNRNDESWWEKTLPEHLQKATVFLSRHDRKAVKWKIMTLVFVKES